MTVVETERLQLREMTVEDLDVLYRLYDDDDARRYLEPLSEDRQEEKEKLDAYIQFVYEFYGFGLWMVIEKGTGQAIGRCGLSVEQIEEEVYVEIGYMIGQSRRHMGFAKEAVRGVLDYAAQELELYDIAACIDRENKASRALCEKIGFVYQKDIIRRQRTMCLYIFNEKSGNVK